MSETECNVPCRAKPTQLCGGSYRNSVYSTGSSSGGSGAAPSTPPAGPAPAVVGREFFVAPGGNDANAGTQAAPFATLEKAQAAVRAVKAAGLPANGVAVTLRGGTYWRSSQLRLTSADSGTADRPVIWRAYPGETVRLNGGKRITGWTAVTSGDANYRRIYSPATLYKASLGLASYGIPGAAMAELFYNRQAMQLGRWPNTGFAAMTGSGTVHHQQRGPAVALLVGRDRPDCGQSPLRLRDHQRVPGRAAPHRRGVREPHHPPERPARSSTRRPCGTR